MIIKKQKLKLMQQWKSWFTDNSKVHRLTNFDQKMEIERVRNSVQEDLFYNVEKKREV